VDLHVGERANLNERVRIDPAQEQSGFLIAVSKFSPELEAKLRPLVDAETVLSDLNRKIGDLEQKEKSLADDEARDRENLKALKDNGAAKRFVDEMNRAEDDLQAARKESAGLEKDRDVARANLDALIAQASFDTDVSVVTQSTQFGNSPPQP
jgi:predicted  nucleic acid-binding Zn-ribbon protein